MRYAEYVPNPLIINRAADLWVEMLKNPRYDNGDSSFVGAVTQALAEMGAKNNTDETLARFKTELVRILSGPHKWHSQEYPGRPSQEFEEVFQHLDVDYNPNIPLADAATAAGLDMQFPWKTGMWLENDHLFVSLGRGPRAYHYPLADGRWLVTSLNGRDIDKIKTLVEQGVLTLDLQHAFGGTKGCPEARETPAVSKGKAVFRPMTDDEREAVRCLKTQVRYTPASYRQTGGSGVALLLPLPPPDHASAQRTLVGDLSGAKASVVTPFSPMRCGADASHTTAKRS